MKTEMLETFPAEAEEPRKIEQEAISFNVRHGKLSLIFHMRMISVAEERRLRQRYADIKAEDPDEKTEADLAINKDALLAFQVKAPEIFLDGRPIKHHREMQEILNDDQRMARIYDFAARAFLSQLTPDVSFL